MTDDDDFIIAHGGAEPTDLHLLADVVAVDGEIIDYFKPTLLSFTGDQLGVSARVTLDAIRACRRRTQIWNDRHACAIYMIVDSPAGLPLDRHSPALPMLGNSGHGARVGFRQI